MTNVCNTGIIECDSPITSEVMSEIIISLENANINNKKLIKLLMDSLGGCEINFNDFPTFDLSSDLEPIVKILIELDLKPCGYIEYYGDYEGKIFINDQGIMDYTKEDCWKIEADDKDLIEVLNHRGYTVVKTGED